MTRIAVYGSQRTRPCEMEIAALLRADGFEVVLPDMANPNVMSEQKTTDAAIILTGMTDLAQVGAVPAVIVPGDAEAWHFPNTEAIPVHLRRRQTEPALYGGIYVRRDLTDYALYGRELAFALNALPNKLAVCLPLKGLSALDDTAAPVLQCRDANGTLRQPHDPSQARDSTVRGSCSHQQFPVCFPLRRNSPYPPVTEYSSDKGRYHI